MSPFLPKPMPQAEQVFAWETPPELWRGLKPNPSGWEGRVVGIYIAPQPAKPMVSVPEVRAFADRGLEGDRFFRESWLAAKRPDKAVSLIEAETLEAAAAELGTETFADKSRRNIVTREKVAKLPGIFRALEHRSGLKAAILRDGVIRVGDSLAPGAAARPATSSL